MTGGATCRKCGMFFPLIDMDNKAHVRMLWVHLMVHDITITLEDFRRRIGKYFTFRNCAGRSDSDSSESE